MGSIKAVCSILGEYYDACRSNYSKMLEVVEVLLEKTRRYGQDVEQKHDHAKRKAGELNMVMPEVKFKADKYSDGMEMCKDRIKEAQREISYYYSHPIVQSTTDSEGNTTTTSTYDYAAIYAAERKESEARRQYNQYNELYSKANAVYQQMDALYGEIEGKREIIRKGLDRIKNCEAELEKYMKQITDEGEHNLKSLNNVKSALAHYVNCSPIEPYGSVAGADFGMKVATQPYVSSCTSAISSGTEQSGFDIHKMVNNNGIICIDCRNSDLVDGVHPQTGVPFEYRKISFNNEIYDVVSPKFDCKYEATLPNEMLQVSDKDQFIFCNRQLENELAKNPDLESQFSDEQISQIMNGQTPDGYTWHHDSYVGNMQLVDIKTHQLTGHTGGRSIWGGGTNNR